MVKKDNLEYKKNLNESLSAFEKEINYIFYMRNNVPGMVDAISDTDLYPHYEFLKTIDEEMGPDVDIYLEHLEKGEKEKIPEEKREIVEDVKNTKSDIENIDKLRESIDDLVGSMGVISSFVIFKQHLREIMGLTVEKDPRIIESFEKTLTYSDLSECESIDDAKNLIVQKEINDRTENGGAKNLNNLLKKFGINLEEDENIWFILKAVFIIRNKVVHNPDTIELNDSLFEFYLSSLITIATYINSRLIKKFTVDFKFNKRC